jgi:5-methylcytosine-specific restriction protein A
MRLAILIGGSYLCTSCHQFGDQVDHVDGDSHNNDPENLQVLCLRCHSAKTMRELNKASR